MRTIRTGQSGPPLPSTNTLKAMGVQANYGIATGRAFCGSIGSAQRREYAIIGGVVNLAARLAEQSSGEIYCDQAVPSLLIPGPICGSAYDETKGISQPVAAFQPSNDSPAIVKTASLIGRKSELKSSFRPSVRRSQERPFVAFVEGEAGIGKSTLIRKWSQAAELAGVRLVSGAAEAIQAATPYFIWKNILETLFKIPIRAPQSSGDSISLRPAKERLGRTSHLSLKIFWKSGFRTTASPRR